MHLIHIIEGGIQGLPTYISTFNVADQHFVVIMDSPTLLLVLSRAYIE